MMDTHDTIRPENTLHIVGDGNLYQDHVGPGPHIMAADTLAGNDVLNSAGEPLGEIEHIMLDVPKGRIAYAVLSFGGFLGMGEKLFAIPWHALKLDIDNKCFILDASIEKLQNAPGFNKGDWPSMADPQWSRNLHSYYSSPPYWE
jgi:sporulation protein YlmC with PRC-barrel domain